MGLISLALRHVLALLIARFPLMPIERSVTNVVFVMIYSLFEFDLMCKATNTIAKTNGVIVAIGPIAVPMIDVNDNSITTTVSNTKLKLCSSIYLTPAN